MIKRALLGRPIATAEEMYERLPKKLALPVFASDAISSTAYATEEILLVLVPVVGMVALDGGETSTVLAVTQIGFG